MTKTDGDFASMTEVVVKAAAEVAKIKAERETRRDLVGGLVRYLKEGNTDFGQLLFHYVHVEDYGQAMVEGWGELHRLLTDTRARTVGAVGLDFSIATEIEQAMLAEIMRVEPELTIEQIVEALERARLTYGEVSSLHGLDENETVAEFANKIGLPFSIDRDDDDPYDPWEEESDEASEADDDPF